MKNKQQGFNAVRRLQYNNYVLKNKLFKVRSSFAILLSVFVVTFSMLIFYKEKAAAQENTIAQMESKIAEQEEQLAGVTDAYEHMSEDFTKLSVVSVELDKYNAQLVSDNLALKAGIDELKERQELFDKYQYAFFYGNERTDITYEQVKNLEELAKEKSLSEDSVNLVLAIAMNESGGKEKIKNPSSSAAGYCGLIKSTARFAYEDLMGNPKGSYNFDLVYDGDLNLAMSLETLDYLYNYHGDNLTTAVISYRGKYVPSYMNKLNNNLHTVGKDLYTLNWEDDEDSSPEIVNPTFEQIAALYGVAPPETTVQQ